MLFRLFIKSTFIFLLAIPFAHAETTLATDTDKISYSIGVNVGKNIKQEQFEINYDLFVQGIKDGISNESILSDTEIEKIITNFQKAAIEKHHEELEKLAKSNLEESKKFLDENKNKTGVKTLPSGLQYQILHTGKGIKPKTEDIVTVNYIGTLINGSEFDNSYHRKTPTTFKLKDVIRGWQEGLQLVNAGSRIKLFIPPDLAYGDKAASPLIGPNSLLIFDIELLKIEPPLR